MNHLSSRVALATFTISMAVSNTADLFVIIVCQSPPRPGS